MKTPKVIYLFDCSWSITVSLFSDSVSPTSEKIPTARIGKFIYKVSVVVEEFVVANMQGSNHIKIYYIYTLHFEDGRQWGSHEQGGKRSFIEELPHTNEINLLHSFHSTKVQKGNDWLPYIHRIPVATPGSGDLSSPDFRVWRRLGPFWRRLAKIVA